MKVDFVPQAFIVQEDRFRLHHQALSAGQVTTAKRDPLYQSSVQMEHTSQVQDSLPVLTVHLDSTVTLPWVSCECTLFDCRIMHVLQRSMQNCSVYSSFCMVFESWNKSGNFDICATFTWSSWTISCSCW